ncbi:hypothetical protein [Alkalilimnicola ehrlichii]|uniref:hypothetical protein n=1 Tax=Alkalilimnicola ehrlichii TaxID=351052 RepID=UPI0015F28190|nr:hypothetical protein [Alkalilimnicola ehrlichii]
MKIKIRKVNKNDDGVQVYFSTSYGSSFAQWVGELPKYGEVYDVELDVDDDLVWGVNILRRETKLLV